MIEGRKSGVLCHITSIPNEYCIGDFGIGAYNFVNFLEKTEQTYWQILPLTHVGSSFSPYQSLSLYALNPMLLSYEKLYEDGYLDDEDLIGLTKETTQEINFDRVWKEKITIAKKACEKFVQLGHITDPVFCDFTAENSGWLNDYSLFMALREKFQGLPWNKWPKSLADREPSVIDDAKENLKDEIEKYTIIQFWLYYQWQDLKRHANEKGITIIGDLPMYPDFDSDIVWANKELFMLDGENNAAFVAGVPPDYFCADGQYWGNPFYNWDYIKKTDYKFWTERFDNIFRQVDIVRIDHFRGFSQAWRVPANEARSAKDGKWYDVPGEELLNAIKKNHFDLPVIAEDLGDIDEKVRELRDKFSLPGMSIMQFAFDSPDSLYLPHNQIKNQVYYTGTHDNDTVLGWWKSCDDRKKDYVRKYLSIDGNDISWQIIQNVFMSSANTVIVPIQDILCLDENYRMNIPGVVNDKNWAFRFSWNMFQDRYVNRLIEIVNLYCRK